MTTMTLTTTTTTTPAMTALPQVLETTLVHLVSKPEFDWKLTSYGQDEGIRTGLDVQDVADLAAWGEHDTRGLVVTIAGRSFRLAIEEI